MKRGKHLINRLKLIKKPSDCLTAIFQPIIDTPNIQHNITEDEFDYYIRTAKEYAKKIRSKLKLPRQNLGDGTGKAEDSSDEDITSIALSLYRVFKHE